VGRRRALRQDVLRDVPGKLVYSTFDWATRDADGYYFVLGRTDDVINVAGHRLGTREIEEAVQAHRGIAEVASSASPIAEGPGAVAFAVVKDPSRVATPEARGDAKEVMDTVDRELGAIGPAGACSLRPRCCPRRAPASVAAARSRRWPKGAIPATCTTIEDPGALRADPRGARRPMSGSRPARAAGPPFGRLAIMSTFARRSDARRSILPAIARPSHVRTRRRHARGAVESTHLRRFAVTDRDGRLLTPAGDPHMLTFHHSAAR
jgi:hypothetical protein